MIFAYKASRFLKNIKFGVEVPQSTRYAFEMDKTEETTVWKDAMDSEITQLHTHETFIVVKEHDAVPIGYKMIP
jgi:hypothetical protein